MKTAAHQGTEVNQHAAIADKKDTTNTNAQRSNQIGPRGKILEYLWMQMATFHAQVGMEITPTHGVNGTSIAKKPMILSWKEKKRLKTILLPHRVSPRLVVVGFAVP